MVGKKFQIGECVLYNKEKGLFLSVHVDDIKLAGKKQNISPTLKFLVKDVDLGKPTSFLDHVHLGCTQRECQIGKDIVDNSRSMFESRISAGATEKLPERKATGKPDAEKISSWKVMQRNAWKDIANLRIKQLSYYTKSQRHAWMIINFKNDKWISWRIIYGLLTNCFEMSILGTYWEA